MKVVDQDTDMKDGRSLGVSSHSGSNVGPRRNDRFALTCHDHSRCVCYNELGRFRLRPVPRKTVEYS